MRISDWSSDVCSSDLLHKPDRFAIALGLAHAEIVLQAAGRIVALFMANHHDAALTQPSEAAEDCLIVAESAITRERDEFVENTSDIMFEVRPLGMAGDLRLRSEEQTSELQSLMR